MLSTRALTITVGGARVETSAAQSFASVVGGGWSELQPFTELGRPGAVVPLRQQVDGERIIITESRFDDERVVVRDPDPHEVAFAADESVLTATFADDLVAVGSIDGIVVRDWRTGAVVSSAPVPEGVDSTALRPDGRAAVTTRDGSLYEVRVGAPPRLLGHAAEPANIALTDDPVAYAGDSLLYIADNYELRVIDASGRRRRFGAPTDSLGGFVTDGSRVAWVANGCVLVDDASAPPATAPDPGPCVRSEIALDYQPQPYLARRLPLRLRCVAAPRTCRGTLRLTTRNRPAHAVAISRRLHFSIPAGHARRLQVPLTCRGYRLMRRTLARGFGAIVHVDARTVDSKRFPGDPRFGVKSGPNGVMRRCG